MIFEPIDAVIKGMADMIGLPFDQMQLIISMGASTFAGVGLNVILGLKLPREVRYLYAIIVGIILQIYMFRWATIHIYIMGLVTFVIIGYGMRGVAERIAIAWVLLYNSALFLYFFITCYGCWEMNVTTYTMILMTKLWGFAWACKDGYTHKQNLTESQKKYCIEYLPTFMEYMGFLSFAPGCLVGPFMEYKDYIDYMELKGDYADMPCGTSMPTLVPSLLMLAKGYSFGLIKEFITSYLGFSVALCGSKEWANYKTFLHRFFHYNVAMTGQRFMYFSMFTLQECCFVSSGLGWNGVKDGANTWDKLPVVILKLVEFSTSPIQSMKGWNHATHLWLNRYVQDRVVPKRQKVTLRETCIVFFISALWHGFYPFYYFMFFFSGMYVELAKDMYRMRILFKWIPAPLDFWLPWACNMIILNFLGVSFCSMTFENGRNFAEGVYYWLWIGLPIALVVIKASGIVSYAKKLEAKAKESNDKKEK